MSVVTADQYRNQTRDLVTSDDLIASSLVEAQELVEDFLRRPLELATRAEVCIVTLPSGYVYPLVTPIISVSDPVDAVIVDGQYLTSHGDDYPNPTGFTAWFDGTGPARGQQARSQITYYGGYTSDTLPATLRRAIIDLVQKLSAGTPAFIAGAQNVSLGDASVSFGNAAPQHQLDQLVPGLTSRLRGYMAR